MSGRKTEKICGCGHVFLVIPKHAVFNHDPAFRGYYWNCICNSTLFHPAPPLDDLIDASNCPRCGMPTRSGGYCADCVDAIVAHGELDTA